MCDGTQFGLRALGHRVVIRLIEGLRLHDDQVAVRCGPDAPSHSLRVSGTQAADAEVSSAGFASIVVRVVLPAFSGKALLRFVRHRIGDAVRRSREGDRQKQPGNPEWSFHGFFCRFAFTRQRYITARPGGIYGFSVNLTILRIVHSPSPGAEQACGSGPRGGVRR